MDVRGGKEEGITDNFPPKGKQRDKRDQRAIAHHKLGEEKCLSSLRM